jgi:hypothetical protein
LDRQHDSGDQRVITNDWPSQWMGSIGRHRHTRAAISFSKKLMTHSNDILRLLSKLAWLMLILLCPFGLCGQTASFADRSTSIDSGSAMECGPNSLYVFLKMCGSTTVQLDVMHRLPISSIGASLLTLRDAAERYEIPAEIRHFHSGAVDSVPVPAIVQLRVSADTDVPNHFCVLYKHAKNHAYLIDGSTGREYKLSDIVFGTTWTGYTLIRRQSFGEKAYGVLNSKQLFLSILCLDFFTIGFAAYILVRRTWNILALTKLKSYLQRPRHLMFLTLVIASNLNSLGAEPPANNWRTAANGGINVLYCYLKVNGIRCDYSELEREQQVALASHSQSTALTIRKLAHLHGVALSVRKLTWDELLTANYPVILHMDGESTDIGAFLLVLSVQDGNVYFINGPTATISIMTLEDFRRGWNGFGLIPASPDHHILTLISVGFCVGFAIAFGACRLRTSKHP